MEKYQRRRVTKKGTFRFEGFVWEHKALATLAGSHVFVVETFTERLVVVRDPERKWFDSENQICFFNETPGSRSLTEFAERQAAAAGEVDQAAARR